MGVILGMANTVYHEQNGISSTAVKTVYKKSLAHWKGERRKHSAAFNLGNAVHALLLEEDKDLVIKGPKTKASKAFKELEETLTDDQVLLTEVEYNVAHCMARSALSNKDCADMLRHKDRVNEASIFVKCPRTGLELKTRPDLMLDSQGSVADVKTTIDSSPNGFKSEVFKYSYDIQAAFYLYVCQLGGFDVKEFSFIAVEKSAPYVAHIHVVGPELMANATERMHRTLDTIAHAESENNFNTGWGSYTMLELPKWL